MAEKTNAAAKQSPVVLAVDDDADILRIVELLLERNGYSVKTAPSGKEALQILRNMQPALLILDVTMPEMSGYDLCQVVKRDKRLQKVPVIFLTAKGTPQDYKTGHEMGAVIYMVKPFNASRLLKVVQLLVPLPEAEP